MTPLPTRSRLPRRTLSSRPTLPSPSRTRPRLSRASSPTTPARRTPTASSVTSAARPASPVSVRSVPRPRLRRLPTLRNRGYDLISTTVKVGVDGFAMTAALCQESRAKNGHYLLIELLLSAGREPKKSLVAPHDTTFYAFCCFPCSCVCSVASLAKILFKARSSTCRHRLINPQTTMFLLRRASPRLVSRPVVRAMSSSSQSSSAVRFEYSAGEDEEQLGRNATALTTRGGGRWKVTNDNRGLERTFRFKTFKATWVCELYSIP